MKNQSKHISFAQILLLAASVVAAFALLVFMSSCSKPCTPEPRKVIDLRSANGRWAHSADTSTHFYIDSLSATTAILRYPTQLHAPLGTYTRMQYSCSIAGDTIYLSANYIIAHYTLYQHQGAWHGLMYLNDLSTQPIAIHQIDNNNRQPGPDPVSPL